MLQEKLLFDKALQKATFVWKITGIQIDYDKEPFKGTFLGYVRNRWFYIINFICLTSAALGVFALMNVMTIQEILYLVPCMTYTLLGAMKTIFFLYHENLVRDVINTLRNLQSIDESAGKEAVVDNFVKNHMPFLNSATNLLLISCYMAVATFCFGPVVYIGWHYWSTNEIHLVLPYVLWYPFDQYSYVGWPIAYVHQFWGMCATEILPNGVGDKLLLCKKAPWRTTPERRAPPRYLRYTSAWLAIFFVYGPDCFYYAACTFVYSQFYSLQFDMKKIGPNCFDDQKSFNVFMGKLIHRHRELIRCVDMINIIFGKSSLYNVVSSSFLICLTGFNVTAIENWILMTPFAAFVVVTSVQIFLLCYYGDLLMRASMDISEAIFSSEWCMLNASSMKICLLIIMRAQQPCKITAYGFRDINLNTFAKILSSAWSYFTLIKTMYSKQNSK